MKYCTAFYLPTGSNTQLKLLYPDRKKLRHNICFHTLAIRWSIYIRSAIINTATVHHIRHIDFIGIRFIDVIIGILIFATSVVQENCLDLGLSCTF